MFKGNHSFRPNSASSGLPGILPLLQYARPQRKLCTGETYSFPSVMSGCQEMGRKSDVKTGVIKGRWSWNPANSKRYSSRSSLSNLRLGAMLREMERRGIEV